MSYLATVLSDLMISKGLRNVDLATKAGIDPATITRWRSGEQISISDEDLEKVATVISDDPREQAELIVARMKDVCIGPGSEFINIDISGGAPMALKESEGSYNVKLPPKVERAFRILRSHVMENKPLRDIIISMANMFQRGDPGDQTKNCNEPTR
jgi:DNA-binding Xre family transcriptional regulator